MKSAVITSGEHWLTINTIAYLRGSITPIEPVTYKDGSEGVKISSSINPLVIAVEGTTIDGVEAGSQTVLINFLRDFAYANGSGGTDGVTQEEFEARNAEVDEALQNIVVGQLPDGSVTPEKTDFIEQVSGGEQFIGNIVSFDTPPAEGAMRPDGTVGTPGEYVHTNPMPVEAGQIIRFNAFNRYVTAFVNGVAVRELGAGQAGTTNPAVDIREYVVPDTVTEIVASPRGTSASTFEVNVYGVGYLQRFKNPAPSNVPLSLEQVQDYGLSNQIRGSEVSIAPKLYGVIGEQLSVYLDSTIKYWRDYKGYSDAQINQASQIVMDRYSQSTLEGNVSGNFIRLANEYFQVVNSVNFDIISGDISNTSPISVMVIGSSTTGQGHFLNYILDSDARTGITWVGTKKSYANPAPNRVNTEGRAGRTLSFYMTLQKGTTDHNPFVQPSGVYKYYGVTGFWSIVKSGSGQGSQYQGYDDYTSMFGNDGYLSAPATNDVMYDGGLSQFRRWDGGAWVNIAESTLGFSFNISKYLSTWNLSAPEIVHVLLGSNDFVNSDEVQAESGFPAYKANMDTLIASFKSANPSVKVIAAIPFSSGLQGEYGTFIQERRKRSNWVFSKNIISSYSVKESEGLYVVDYNAVVDRRSAYSDTEKIPYDSYSGENRDRYTADPVHLSVNGYEKQLGVSFAGIIQHLRSI